MFIIFNIIGILMAFVVFAVESNFNSPLMAGGIGIVIDIGYRVIFRNKDYTIIWILLAPTCGGQIFFVPIWVWAIVLLLEGGMWI